MKHVFFILLIMISALKAQQTIYVIDAKTNESIAFSTLIISNSKMSFMANETGEIFIPFANNNDEVEVQHLAYKTFKGMLSDSIRLNKKQVEMPEVLVNVLSAKTCLKKVIENWTINYPLQTHYLHGVYTQIHKEDDRYVRFIQAKASVESLSNSLEIKKSQENIIAIKALRKSYNYEKNGDQHGDHFVDLLMENPIQYMEKWMLHPKNMDSYEWTMEVDSGYYKLHFRSLSWNGLFNYAGDIKVNQDNYAVESIKVLQYKSDVYNRENKSNWWFINGWYEASYENFEGHYYLHACNKWYYHMVESDTKRRFYVEENFNWLTKTISLENNQSFTFKNYSNLYSANLPYNPSDWQELTIPSNVKVDLEGYVPLETQFIKKGNE